MPSLFSQLKEILDYILSFAVIVYVIGFIVVNAFYTGFGIIDFQLVQTRYIAAALVFLIFHITIGAAIGAIASLIEVIFERSTGRILRWIVWSVLFLIVWIILGFPAFHWSQEPVAVLLLSTNALVIIAFAWLLQNPHTLISERVSPDRNQADSDPKLRQQSLRNIMGNVAYAFAIVIVVVSCVAWGKYWWPEAGTTVGGGRPNKVVLILQKDQAPLGGLPYIPMQNETVSEEIPLLYESPDSYAVLVKGATSDMIAVSLPKSAVYYVVHAPVQWGGEFHDIPTLTPSPVPTSTPSS